MELRPVLEQAFRSKRFITSSELQRALGQSRQTVWSRLRPMVASGELILEGVGRGVRYRPGAGFGRGRRGATRGEDPEDYFWPELAQALPRFVYISIVGAACGTTRKHHAEALVKDLPLLALVVVDFDGVRRIGGAFARSLFHGLHVRNGMLLVAINASEDVRVVLEQARRLELRRGRNPFLD